MEDRGRELPGWMSNKGKAKPKQATANIKKVSRTVYCMNEKELVEAAIAFIGHGATFHNDHQVNGDRSTDGKQDCSDKMEEASDESCSSDAQDRTYISETDMDPAEDAAEETVSPHLCCHGQQSEGGRSMQAGDSSHGQPAVDPGATVVAEAPPTEVAETPPTEVEEDDAFKLVREIFFT